MVSLSQEYNLKPNKWTKKTIQELLFKVGQPVSVTMKKQDMLNSLSDVLTGMGYTQNGLMYTTDTPFTIKERTPTFVQLPYAFVIDDIESFSHMFSVPETKMKAMFRNGVVRRYARTTESDTKINKYTFKFNTSLGKAYAVENLDTLNMFDLLDIIEDNSVPRTVDSKTQEIITQRLNRYPVIRFKDIPTVMQNVQTLSFFILSILPNVNWVTVASKSGHKSGVAAEQAFVSRFFSKFEPIPTLHHFADSKDDTKMYRQLFNNNPDYFEPPSDDIDYKDIVGSIRSVPGALEALNNKLEDTAYTRMMYTAVKRGMVYPNWSYPVFVVSGRLMTNSAFDINRVKVLSKLYKKGWAFWQIILNLYGVVDDNDTAVVKIAGMAKHPIEDIILRLGKISNYSNIVSEFGMMIPGSITTSRYKIYIYMNIQLYRDILPRYSDLQDISTVDLSNVSTFDELTTALSRYSDFEIIQGFGVHERFTNRSDLIRNLTYLLNTSGFIIIEQLNPANTVETPNGAEPVEDLKSPYIVYGTIKEYYPISLDDLEMGFSPNSDTGLITFRKITSFGLSEYTDIEVNSLAEILHLYREIASVDDIDTIDNITKYIGIGFVQRSGTAKTIEDLTAVISDDSKRAEITKQYLMKMFEAAMYMRRWKGPGNPYPQDVKSTTGSDDPIPIVSTALLDAIDIGRSLPIEFLKIPMIGLADGKFLIGEGPEKFFVDFVEIVRKGEYCIRMASRPILLTTYFYLTSLFREIIPGFDPLTVDSIA
jgi:hypothetical protein